ncbi:MAG: hypothetical protein LBI91_05290 [Spirochaetaceae bacterium]|nr:hypothetical protein [Spirochaetaceae bacterium]
MGDMTTEAREPPGRIGPEEVWAMFRDTDRRMKETDQQMKETDLQTKKLEQVVDKISADIDRMIKEADQQMKEVAEQMRETDRKIGKLGSRLGDVVEHIMSPKLQEKFESLGFSFNHTSRNHEIEDSGKNLLAEIDVLLENGEYAMAVEVKTHLTTGDIRGHIKRMGILRKVADDHNDRRKYLGAVAGAVVDKEVLAFALKNGFFVIVPSGETVDVEAPEGFTPRIW